MEPSPSRRLFRGSELPRLLMLGTVMIVGWGLVWRFANQRPQPAEPVAKAEPKPEPVVHDGADEFETVTDRTPMSFRDNAAYAYLLAKAQADAGRARRAEPAGPPADSFMGTS